jgi:hypothetical protein
MEWVLRFFPTINITMVYFKTIYFMDKDYTFGQTKSISKEYSIKEVKYQA